MGQRACFVRDRLPHKIRASFRLLRSGEKRFRGVVSLAVTKMFGHVAHKQLALLKSTNRIPERVREGWFRRRKNGTPFKLSDFINEGSPPDYKGARNIINHPSSFADKFAGFADKFELILRASLVS